jgi:hypothetical protein
VLSDGQAGLEIRTDLLLIEIDGILFVLPWDVRNIHGDENVSGLLFESNEHEKDPSEVIFGSLVAFDWMGGGEEHECWVVAKQLSVSLVFICEREKTYGILVRLAVSSLQNLTSSVSVETMSLKWYLRASMSVPASSSGTRWLTSMITLVKPFGSR